MGNTQQAMLLWAKRFAAFFLGAAFLMPLVFAEGILPMPYVTSKVFFFRTVVLLLAATCGVMLAFGAPAARVRFSPIGIALLLWSAVLVLAVFFSADRAHSWWADYDRMMGVFTLLHYTLFFFVARALLQGEKLWERLLFLFVLIGFFVCTLALLEQFHLLFPLRDGARISSTIGGAVPFSLYAAFVAMVALYQAFRAAGRWRALYGVVAILSFSTALLSETRGTIIALVVVGVLSLIRAAVREKKRFMKLGMITALLGIMLGGVLFASVPTVRNSAAHLPIFERFFDEASFAGGTATRLAAWKYAYEGFRARPFFGWGPVNYFLVFNTYYEPRLIEYGLQETWFDVAHNIFLEILATSGGLGLLSYLGVIGTALFLVARKRRWFLFCLLLLYLIYGMFEIEDPTTYFLVIFLLLWIDKGTLMSLRTRETGERDSVLASAPVRAPVKKIFFVIPVLALAIFWYTDARPAYGAYLAEQGDRALLRDGNAAEWFSSYKEALKSAPPHQDSVRITLARTLVRMNIRKEQAQDPLVLEAFKMTLDELLAGSHAHPNNPFFFTLAGDTLVRMHELLDDNNALEPAISLYQQALEVAPRRQQIYFVLADTLLRAGRLTEAQETADYARSLAPEYEKTKQLYEAFVVRAAAAIK